MREVQVSFPRGKVVRERYIVEELLGKGGFGAVYRVRDRRVRSNVFALKEVVDPNGYERDRLAFECEILKRLDHRGLPRVYRVFEDGRNNRFYMLMDYIEGPNLEKLRLQQPEKRFSVPQVMRIMASIVEAIGYLHTQQPPIIHRDIKPSNIIVPMAGDGDGAVLVDFGIAKEYDQDSTTTAVRHCSPGYGAPEHYARGTNTRTDIYGVAATCYTLLTGKVPIDALYRMTQLGSKHEDPLEPVNTLVPTIPQHIVDALQQAMAINSNDRFATIEEFWQALKLYPIEEEEPASLPTLESRVPADQRDSAEVFTPPVRSTSDAAARNEAPEVHSSRVKRDIPFTFVVVALILVALITGSLFGLGTLSGTRGSASLTKDARSTALALTSTPKVSSTATGTTTPSAQPTKSPVTPATDYPFLSANYVGRISDKYTNPSTDTSMSLSRVQQDGAAISGYFAVGPGLIGRGSFNGSVNLDSKIQFLVPGSLVAPLFFQGQIQPDGSMSGTYCSQLHGVCNQTVGGFGTWSVSATANGTRLISARDTSAFAISVLPDAIVEQKDYDGNSG